MKSDPNHYINRELSWLKFNQRVLNQAQYAKVPVLERLKFLAITSSNMDEFFMVRVGGLQLQQAQGIDAPDPSGATVTEQLDAVYARVNTIISDQYECFLNSIEPILQQEGITRVISAKANALCKESLQRFFEQEVYPVLWTPMLPSRSCRTWAFIYASEWQAAIRTHPIVLHSSPSVKHSPASSSSRGIEAPTTMRCSRMS
jgi:polyphosphate kinase